MHRIKVLQLNDPIVVEGVKVTFLDANHCPGSAMILFEAPGRRPVLHTGDCRHVLKIWFLVSVQGPGAACSEKDEVEA